MAEIYEIEVGSPAWKHLYDRAMTVATQHRVRLQFPDNTNVKIAVDGGVWTPDLCIRNIRTDNKEA